MIDIGKDLQQAFEDGYKKGFADGQSQPTIQPQGIDKDRLIEVLTNYFSIGDSYCYNLTRDKAAFEIGTMSLEDFEEFDEETVDDLAEYIIKNYQQPTSDGWIPVSKAVGIGYLYDWYISSVLDDEPVWTEKHLEELFNDFILIPKPLPQP